MATWRKNIHKPKG